MTDFLRPAPDDLALGPRRRVTAPPFPRTALSARTALEAVVERSLTDSPVFVSFSGGRDSSAVLAVATRVARRGGLPDPVPVTLRYPGDHASDEREWQDLVVGHLGIRETVVIDDDDPPTYLGPAAQANLRRRGLLWPPALQIDDPLLVVAQGGKLLTGEGGDEVLGPRRVTPLTLLRMGRRPDRELVGWAAQSLLPRRLTGASVRRELAHAPSMRWLTRRGRTALLRATVEDDRRPLHWGRETRAILTGLPPRMLLHNLDVVARENDVVAAHPLLDPLFLSALATQAGRWGYAGRTHLMRELFHDLLPDAVLARSSKASFGGVRWGIHERAFARTWDGGGLPSDLVDIEAVRAEWLSSSPAGSSAFLLHAAWLHSQGLSVLGERS